MMLQLLVKKTQTAPLTQIKSFTHTNVWWKTGLFKSHTLDIHALQQLVLSVNFKPNYLT